MTLLSPVIFLTVFNPPIELSSCLTTSGFSLKVPVPNSVGLPPVNSTTYVYWDENSDKPVGWYYAVVKKHLSDSTTNIEYANKDTETVNLHSVKWESTKKPYLPGNSKSLSFHLKRSERKPLNQNSSIHPATRLKLLLMTFQSSPLHRKITNPSC